MHQMSQSPSSPVTDIVSYLRNCAEWCEAEFDVTDGNRMLEAADEIERLRAAAAQQQDPIAWRWWTGSKWALSPSDPGPLAGERQPLYAVPLTSTDGESR